MKKILILILLTIALVVNAQTEHLRFMGIPLDGKISSFDREIRKKGFSLDSYTGKKFDGTYEIQKNFPLHKSIVNIYY